MKNKKEMLIEYAKVNIVPILVDFIEGKDLNGAVVLNANISPDELVGHYEGIEYCPPKWFKSLDNKFSILIIDKIDTISKEEQLKFKEILEYRKVSTFEIPKNTIIIVTTKKINKDTINEEIYSLVAVLE